MDSGTQINFNEIKKEIEWFIDKVKPESVGQGKYNVYVTKIYEDGNRCCITIGVIQDSLSMSYLKGFKYYMQINEDLVLLDYSDELRRKYEFESNDIHPLIDKRIVRRKIYNGGVVIGTTQGYVCCYQDGNIKKTYYENADQVPYNQAIFEYTPNGELIEMDSGSLKQIIRERKKN